MVCGHRTLCEGLAGEDGETNIIIRTARDELCGHLLGGFDTIRPQVLGQHGCRDIHTEHDINTFDGAVAPGVTGLWTAEHEHNHQE